MKDEIKLELLKVSFERFIEFSDRFNELSLHETGTGNPYSQTGKPPGESQITAGLMHRSFEQMKGAMEEHSHYLAHFRPLMVSWDEVKRIHQYAQMIKTSRGFRFGNALVKVVGRLFGKGGGIVALDRIIDLSHDMLEEFNNTGKLYDEPPHYLHPAFMLSPRRFQAGTPRSDGSIAIVVLNLNGESHLEKLFESFLEYNTYQNFKFYIVDHHSSDKSQDVIGRYRGKIPIDLFVYRQNMTFSFSNNYAVDRTNEEFLLFLNNDVIFTGDMLAKYVEAFQRSKDIGIVGALLYQPGEPGAESGKAQHAGITFRPEIDRAFPDNRGALRSGDREPGEANTSEKFILRPVNSVDVPEGNNVDFPAVTGAALMIRREDYVSLHGFDENFIWGYEDVDLCLSCLDRLNKRVLLSKEITMIHNEGTTRKQGTVFNPDVREHNLNVLQKKHGKLLRTAFHASLQQPGKHITHPRPERALDIALPNFFRESSRDSRMTASLRADHDKDKVRIAIKSPVSSQENADNWGDTNFVRSLSAALESAGFLVRVDNYENWYDHGYLDDEVVLVIRGLKRYFPASGQLNLLWNISHPELVADEEYEGFDHVFVASSLYAEKLRSRLKVPVSVLLQCTDTSLFYPDVDPDVPRYEYLFVGNSRGHFRESVKHCLENDIPVSVFGLKWEEFIPGRNIKGTLIPNDRLRYYYSSCKVLFNDHWKEMSESGFISNRLFDALACGAVIISDYVTGGADLFKEGVLWYRSGEEFANASQKLSENFDALKSGALRMSETVRSEHSFEDRAMRIKQVVFSRITRQNGKPR